MRSGRSIPHSRPERTRGFSLIELLVAMVMSGVALGSVVQFYAVHMREMREHLFRVETEQALRGSLDAVTRDVRLAGACLPAGGQFISLAGTNSVNGDSVTVRTGLVRTNMSCIQTTLTSAAANGAVTLQLESSNGFVMNMLGYVRHPNGSGQLALIQSVAGNTITLQTGLTQDYPANSGFYAVDERIYAIDRSNPDVPMLTLAVNRGGAQNFAAGINDLQIAYVLDRNCPSCDEVALPADTATWSLVNRVQLTVEAQSVGAVTAGDLVTLVASSDAKPRNLLP